MSKNNEYIDLRKNNGRLFPSWVLLNFKKYKLPEIIIDSKSDPCNSKQVKKNLRKYQEFLSKFLDYRSPYRDMLIYHGLGAGKTAATINVYNILYNNNPDWNVYILIPASLRKNPWEEQLNEWLSKDDFQNRFNNIKFIHFDSPIADKKFIEEIKLSDSNKKNLFIFDETHNFIKNVYNNLRDSKGQRALYIYNYIKKLKMEDPSTRILLLTGTPAINQPFELGLIYNLLRPGIFPDNELQFKELFISGNHFNDNNKNMFQRRIMGLTSYYRGATKEYFASKKIYNIPVVMSEYQADIYKYFEDIEIKLQKKNSNSTTYNTYTRQSSNFVFPPMTSKIKGETRPRPSSLKNSELETQKLIENNLDIDKNKEYNIKYLNIINLYIREFTKYLNKIVLIDKQNNRSINKDIEVYKTKYKNNFSDFYNNYKDKSMLLKKLYECSCKFIAIIFKIISSTGPVLMFSNFVKMEGLQLFKIYLSYFGYVNYDKNKKDYKSYTEYHGGINKNIRENNRLIFNNINNKNGKEIKIILLSPAGTEGIDLYNIREVYILEPYWNEVRTEQLIGRAIRQCGHKNLPMKDRHVDVYRYRAIRKNKKETIDETIEKLSKKKHDMINNFIKIIKQTAVDCELFKNHNMIEENYQCFKFNQPSLFNKEIGPAYKVDLSLDKKFDNGLNSINSQIKRIKVKEIYAVKYINEEKFTDRDKYWLDMDTNIVYDHDVKFTVGKLKIHPEYDIPYKMDRKTFVIGDIVPIPKLRYI